MSDGVPNRRYTMPKVLAAFMKYVPIVSDDEGRSWHVFFKQELGPLIGRNLKKRPSKKPMLWALRDFGA